MLLIESGTDKKGIRNCVNSIFIKKKNYDLASASVFKLHAPVSPVTTTITQTQLKPTTNQEIWNPICLLLLKALAKHDPPNNIQATTSDWLFNPNHNTTSASHNNLICSNHQKNPVTCCYFNARSLVNKISNFNHWFTHLITTLFLFLKHGYPLAMIRKFPLHIFAKTDILAVVESWFFFGTQFPTAVNVSTAVASNPIEAASVNLMLRKTITVCCIYNPPCTANLQLNEIVLYLSAILHSNPRNSIVLVGDFNLHDVNWDSLTATSSASSNFCDFIFDNALLQINDIPTQTGATFLTSS